MKAISFVAVACILVVGSNAIATPKGLHKDIEFKDKYAEECFEALDVNPGDNKITKDDLKIHYYHKEGAYSVQKFIDMIDSKEGADKIVTKDELAKFMKIESVKLAVAECHFVKSTSLRMHCLADQVLTYVALILDMENIKGFFDAIAGEGCNELGLDQVKPFFTAIKNPHLDNLKITVAEEDLKNLLIEIGGTDQKITRDEFTSYVSQESLHDDFRKCRGGIPEGQTTTVYDKGCLGAEMIYYTMNQFTEYDIVETYNAFDSDGHKPIELSDVKAAVTGCDDTVAQKFIKLMDKTNPKDQKVSYPEFRVFVNSHSVRTTMERKCSIKPTQSEEVECYKETVVELVKEFHTPIWLTVPDLDMFFTFEELDYDNDGKIEVQDDLTTGKSWSADSANKLIGTMDGPDAECDVQLEEFNEAVDEPNLVYAMGVCMHHGLEHSRIDCYETQLKEALDNAMSDEAAKSFFEYYAGKDKNLITKAEVLAKGVEEEDAQNFVDEMGMGDHTVNFREFLWYVKQVVLSKKFNAEGCASDLSKLHTTLLKHHEEEFTEFDSQQLFAELDKDHDHEIENEDFDGPTKPKFASLITKIDGPDKDTSVNFHEFWLYMKTPLDNPRLKHLEEQCTKKFEKQDDEMKCYKQEIVNCH